MSEWFDGLKYAEELHKDDGYGSNDIKLEQSSYIYDNELYEFGRGMLDYADHLQMLEQLNDSCD